MGPGRSPGRGVFGNSFVQIKIFTMAFSPRLGGFDDEPLRLFIRDKRVHSIESWHFIHEGTPYWSAFVSYPMFEETPKEQTQSKSEKTDKDNWRKLLTDLDWPVFNALREWRKTRATEEGVPPYLVLTNEQLTRIVVDRVASLAALGRISGVGPSRVEKYGKDVLRILHGKRETEHEPRQGTPGTRSVDGISGMAATDDGEVPEEGAVDLIEPDRQSGAGRGDDVDRSAIHEDLSLIHT